MWIIETQVGDCGHEVTLMTDGRYATGETADYATLEPVRRDGHALIVVCPDPDYACDPCGTEVVFTGEGMSLPEDRIPVNADPIVEG